MFKLGAIFFFASYITVAVSSPSCTCSREAKQVCGSDGKTYSNLCILNCAQSSDPSITLHRLGSCEDSVPQEGTEEASSRDESCQCPTDRNYVCGSDGNTYNNACLLRCNIRSSPGLHITSNSPCDNSVKVVERAENLSCVCDATDKPVCASNGVTFVNRCLMRCAGTHLRVQHPGACEI